MSKTVCKFELDGKIQFAKPFILTESINSIRGIIKDRITSPFVFLDSHNKVIAKEDEANLKLEDIIDEKIIKLQTEGANQDVLIINISDDNEKLFSININIKIRLNQARKLINKNLHNDFIFLDLNHNNIDNNDENDFYIENILKDDTIKIKLIKLEKPKDKINFDFSKHKVIEKRDDLTIYLYSDRERVSNHQFVYQYFFDQFDAVDFDNAYVVLFCGKIGEGKTTAINAFFNIIKGITLEDNYRFILIHEPKGKKESENDGVHLYYVKDYNNKQLIIIDSHGYANDIRGRQYDEKIYNAFAYVFSSIFIPKNTFILVYIIILIRIIRIILY